MRILLVDDEDIIHRTVGAFLRDFGHEVVSARDGGEAVDYLSAQGFDLVFSDIRMPVLGGLELLKVARERFPDTPVVLMTGYGDEDTDESAQALGALSCLKKPVGLREFIAYIDRVAAEQGPAEA